MSQARTSEDRPPTAEERYLSAKRSSNLRVSADRSSGADALLAAAFAVSGDDKERKQLALAVYGVLSSTDMRGATEVADKMSGRLVRRRYTVGAEKISRIEAYDLAMLLLKMWHKRTCPECSGRGHPLMDGAPVQDESIDCKHCYGTGHIPLERIFKENQIEHARWLEREINVMCSFIFNDMAKLLSRNMDL